MLTKNIREKGKFIAVILSLTFSIGLYAKNIEITNRTTKYSKAVSLSGKDLFKGLMFYSGKAADLTEISAQQKKLMSRLDTKLQNEYSLIQDQILNVLEAKDSKYFDKFKKSINSGNHILIQNAIKSSSNDIRNIAAKLYNIDITGNTSADNLATKMLANSK